MRSIRDNITEEDLLNEISEIIRLPMYADRIRNDSKANQHANVARRRWLVAVKIRDFYAFNLFIGGSAWRLVKTRSSVSLVIISGICMNCIGFGYRYFGQKLLIM